MRTAVQRCPPSAKGCRHTAAPTLRTPAAAACRAAISLASVQEGSAARRASLYLRGVAGGGGVVRQSGCEGYGSWAEDSHQAQRPAHTRPLGDSAPPPQHPPSTPPHLRYVLSRAAYASSLISYLSTLLTSSSHPLAGGVNNKTEGGRKARARGERQGRGQRGALHGPLPGSALPSLCPRPHPPDSEVGSVSVMCRV